DNATGLPTGLPAFGTTNAGDASIAATEAASNTTSVPTAAVLTGPSIPSYLQSPAAARAFLDYMQKLAMDGAAESPDTATYLPNVGSCTPTGVNFCSGGYSV